MSYVARNHPQQVGRRSADDQIDDRATPWELFDALHTEFRFTVDAAASERNARLPRFWTVADNALSQNWRPERVWCNPPYSAIEPWVEKALADGPEVAVLLVPANRTEQGWWQRHVEPARDRGVGLAVRFLPGRIRFVSPDRDQRAEHANLFGERASSGIPPDSRPPFGCCLLIFESGEE